MLASLRDERFATSNQERSHAHLPDRGIPRVFVRYVQENEPGTKMYLAWQEKNDPTRFNHLFIFENEEAQARHGKSAAVRQFESLYSPELVGGDVVFTDYEMIAGKPTAEQWVQKPNSAKAAAKGKRR